MKTNAFLSMVFTLKTLPLNEQTQQKKTLSILRSLECTYALLWLLCQTGSTECTTFLKAQSCLDFSRKTCLNFIVT
jgi:hypothetical protein